MTVQTALTDFAPAERSSSQEIQEQNALFQNNPLLKRTLDAMPNMVAILDENRQIVMANAALVNTLGNGELDRVLGTRPGEAIHCPHALEKPHGCGTTRSCRTCGVVLAILAAQQQKTATRECSIQPDGHFDPLDLRIKASPMEIEGQQFTIFAIQDIAHENRAKLLERTFFHDILNASGGVQGLATLIDDAEDMEEVQEYAPLLVIQADQLVAAIESQREIMAAERGQLRVKFQPAGSLNMLQAAIDLYGNHQVAEGRIIQKDPGSARVILTTGKTLLQRTLGNMLKNALEASKPGDIVTLGCDDESGQVRFWVHNPSVMSAEVKLQVFQRSFSTKGTGRGIGTYSMKLLGEKYLGGQVGFTSEDGEGTTFWIRLPLQLDESGDDPAVPAT